MLSQTYLELFLTFDTKGGDVAKVTVACVRQLCHAPDVDETLERVEDLLLVEIIVLTGRCQDIVIVLL